MPIRIQAEIPPMFRIAAKTISPFPEISEMGFLCWIQTVLMPPTERPFFEKTGTLPFLHVPMFFHHKALQQWGQIALSGSLFRMSQCIL